MKLATIREGLLPSASDTWEVVADRAEMLVLALPGDNGHIRSNVVCQPVPSPAGDDFAALSTAVLLGSEPPSGPVLGHQLVIDGGDALEVAQEFLWLGDDEGVVRIVATSVAGGHGTAAILMARARAAAATQAGGES